MSLIVGQERQIAVAGSDPQATWQSDNSAAVAVSSTGLVSALAPGIAHVVVRQKSATDTATVTVHSAIGVLQLTADSIYVAVGRSARLSYQAFDATGAVLDSSFLRGLQIRWSSTLPAIAIVDSAGVVSGVSIGQAAIVLDVDGNTDTTIVNVVSEAISTIALSVPPQFGISVSSPYKVVAVAKDASGNELSGRMFTWSSSNPSVATVSQDGTVAGIATGSARITASAEGHAAFADALVSGTAVASVDVSVGIGTIAIGQGAQATAVVRDAKGNTLTGRAVLWSSDNPAIATVSSVGVLTGVSVGTATIKAVVDGITGSATLRVVSVPSATSVATVAVAVAPSSLTVGQNAQATATARDASGSVLSGKTASWTSLTPTIATVSSTTGVVAGLSPGSAVIQATIDGIVGQTSVSVSGSSVTPPPPPSGGALASADFEDGTFDSFYNPWGPGIDIVSDPTGGGRSKVSRARYTTNGTTQVDANLDLTPKSLTIGLGDSLWFSGDFYLDANANMTPIGPQTVQRKLLYWGWNGSGGHPSDMVLTSFGPQMVISNVPHPSFEAGGLTWLPVYITAGKWHNLKVQLKLNSSFGASDGVLRVWYDGDLVFDHADMRWTDPSWTDVDQATFKWTDWGVGTQVSTGAVVDEYRYWDNLIFSKTPIQP